MNNLKDMPVVTNPASTNTLVNNLEALQNAIQEEIENERNAEIKAIKEAEKQAEKDGERKMKLFDTHFKGLGIDSKKYEAYNKELIATNDADIKSLQQKLSGSNDRSLSLAAEDIQAISVDSALLDTTSQRVYPAFVKSYNTQEQTVEEIAALDVIYNGSTQKRYNWAKGAGSGLFGTGAASNTQWVEFGFWFKPSASKVYSIIPLNMFRGYYILKADDAWYDSKYTRASVNIWINVKQYNWKGWSTHNVMNVGDDNINVNKRLDTNRSNYHSALLGGGDWAFIRVVVQMYVYARGGGSYAELNFAAGTANYLRCPYCVIS